MRCRSFCAMKILRPALFRRQWQLWVTLLCCLGTTALAAPTKKKKKRSATDLEPVRAMPARAGTVKRALPAEAAPQTLPGGVPATRAAAVIVIDARSGEV